ncbi:5'-flap endonuclease [Aspergillus tubingensis]|nr:5'-flap endonuclease [Aspergillus tubingensis]
MSATAEVLVLSSSPERNPVHTPAPPAYDPERLFGLSPVDVETTPIPSPSELFCPPTHSKFFEVGNRVDESRRKGFRKNSSNSTNDELAVITLEEEPAADKPKRRGRPKKEQKKAAEESGSVAGTDKTIAKKTTTGASKKRAEPATKRSKPANKTISGRVAKAGSSQPKEAGEKAVCPLTPQAVLPQQTTKDVLDWERDGLQLEPAMTRRLDWTPTTKKAKEVVQLEGKSGPDDITRGFGNLLSEYGFNGSAAPASDYVPSDNGAPTKRRRIELVDPGVYPTSRQSVADDSEKDSTEGTRKSTPATRKKPTQRAKKFTTLTARVTAKYINESTEGSDVVEEETPKAKPRASRSKKKGQEPEFVVLSPEEAAKSLDDQELVFGTCSQLEREDSPTTIRELQAAISESERSMTLEAGGRPHRMQSRGSSTVSRFNGSGNLWSVASRDVDGSLMQVEVVDLIDSPDRSGTITPDELPSIARGGAEAECNTSDFNPTQKDGVQAKAILSSEAQPIIPAPITQTTNKKTQNFTSVARKSDPKMPQYNDFTDAQLSKQAASFGFKPLKNRKKMIELLEKCWKAKNGIPSEMNDENAQQDLSADPAPVPAPGNKLKGKGTTRKTTTKAKAKSQPSTSSKSTTETISTVPDSTPSNNPNPTTIPSTSPPKPPPSYANVEEIEDSEDDSDPIPFPSPSRLLPKTHQTKHKHAPSLPTSNIPSSPNRTTTTPTFKDPEPPAILLPLTEQITKAVRAQSATRTASSHTQNTHTKKQTWHEKILMYDPIPLEEFTTWLNTEGLGLVNEDREVGAGFVRRWCESKGVVCCYRPKRRE